MGQVGAKQKKSRATGDNFQQKVYLLSKERGGGGGGRPHTKRHVFQGMTVREYLACR